MDLNLKRGPVSGICASGSSQRERKEEDRTAQFEHGPTLTGTLVDDHGGGRTSGQIHKTGGTAWRNRLSHQDRKSRRSRQQQPKACATRRTREANPALGVDIGVEKVIDRYLSTVVLPGWSARATIEKNFGGLMRATIVILLPLVCASLPAWGQDNTAIVLPAPPARPQAFAPQVPATPVLAPLRLEWPAWLELPGAPPASQRTNPPGRIGRWAEETCPGDVMGKPSQGCLKRVYQCSNNLKEVYQFFEGLLYQHGYTTENLSKQPYANLQLGKSIGDVFASLTMREYPAPQDENYYRQVIVFMRQPQTTTKVEITFMVKGPQEVEGTAGVSGTSGAAASSAPVRPATSRRGDHLSWPPPRGTWSWAIQSVAVHRGSGIGYTSFYYEASTDRSVEEPLSLPAGGTVVGVFPDDCEFSMKSEAGKSFIFRNEAEAKTKPVAPGTWSVYPRGCGGVAVFLR